MFCDVLIDGKVVGMYGEKFTEFARITLLSNAFSYVKFYLTHLVYINVNTYLGITRILEHMHPD